MKTESSVQAWEESVTIPTYPVPPPDPNPMFLEKRVYQGSSGKVYPNAFTDRICNQRKQQAYKAVFLENEYIKLMILPEIGGRIHIGLDKTNDYDFFYRQRVIKPALVGLLGPWISGGVEFNWPQHVRDIKLGGPESEYGPARGDAVKRALVLYSDGGRGPACRGRPLCLP